MNRRGFFTASALAAAGVAGFRVAAVNAADSPATGLVAAREFRIGEALVTALSDGYLPIDASALIGIDAEGFSALLADAYLPGPAHPTGVNAYLVDHGGRLTLIDAGTGTAFGDSLGHLVSTMTALGLNPAAVDAVCATHLHPDHIGGILTEAGNPFANASLHVNEDDLAFWSNGDIKSQAPAEFQGFFDMAMGAVEAFGDRLMPFKGESDLGAGLTSLPLPGHTPGHSGFMLSSGDDTLLFFGDIVHVGPVQFPRPEITIGFDVDTEVAAATRARVFDMASADRLRIAGAHISFPGVGYVEAATEGYRFVPQSWQYG
ncbi:MAG: MBL fold metallo-hydrolase [Dinoroseobacter sp.]|nr:MBL fold metallo-hydrolase [Dinoroseobacter sp.]